MGPPHWGQDHVEVEGWRVEQPSSSPGRSSGTGGKSAGRPRNWKQSGKRAARRRWARKPKWRMRTKPGGSTWSRKRRKNSSTARVIRRCWLPCAESLQRKVTWLSREGDQAVIGDRHAVGVAAEITENVFGTTEGRLAVDHPVLTEERTEESSESLRFHEKLEVPVEAQLTVVEGAFECSDKLAAEDSTQHLDGKKEAIARGCIQRW